MPRMIIRGPIIRNNDKWIYDWFEMEAFCPQDAMAIIDKAMGEDIEIDIASGGGDVFAGSDIYTALKSYKGRIIINITSIAASAASVIASAGNIVRIAPTAQIMIHNVASVAAGDHREMAHQSDVLLNFNKSIANAYRLKTNLTEAELLEMMNKETWLTAQQAKEKGFADEIMFDGESRLVASGINAGMLPLEIISKMQNSGNNPTCRRNTNQLALLKLKGGTHV